MQHYFVTAIGTDSGKSVVSAILCEALQAHYWKPVQCGTPTDTEFIRRIISNGEKRCYAETYMLKMPASPHTAAAKEGYEINLNNLEVEFNSIHNNTIVEGAGGILVPLNDEDVIIDIPQKLNIPVVLVVNMYLGNINHTLLTIEELKRRKLDVKGIVFNGADDLEVKDIILKKSGFKELLHILIEPELNNETILKYAKRIKKHFS